MNFILPFVFVLFLTLPAAADFSYNPKTDQFTCLRPTYIIQEKEYHDLSVQVLDILVNCSMQSETLDRAMYKIIFFLKQIGTGSALQLAEDMCSLWGYEWGAD